MGPTYPFFELNLTIYFTYLCAKFGDFRIEIVTSRVHKCRKSLSRILVEKYDFQTSETFRLEMTVKSLFLKILYAFRLLRSRNEKRNITKSPFNYSLVTGLVSVTGKKWRENTSHPTNLNSIYLYIQVCITFISLLLKQIRRHTHV